MTPEDFMLAAKTPGLLLDFLIPLYYSRFLTTVDILSGHLEVLKFMGFFRREQKSDS